MKKLFEIVFLDEVFDFLKNIEIKHYEKILYNIRKAQVEHDPDLFKKLKDDIWEFRTLYQGHKYRLFAFWDKSDKQETVVVSTHGFIKKKSKVSDSEIERAKRIRKQYFIDKMKNKDENSKNDK